MSAVPGLTGALKLYESDKIKDRAQGGALLREIIGNRANLEVLQATANRDGGKGWVALFQCLFASVLLEKKTVIKKTASHTESGLPAALIRLSDAANLVRFAAERSVHMIGRKPLGVLLLHMVTLLVQDGRIFEPVALNYVKTLRTLLSYPPHLEHMDEGLWRRLMSVCWATILGERIPVDSELTEERENDDSEVDAHTGSCAIAGSALLLKEVISLVPILLSSSSAPLIPAAPAKIESAKPALGLSILSKIHRHFDQDGQGLVSTDVLRALNILLGELELNCRQEFTEISLKLFPQLAAMWTARTKGDLGHREHILVALRTMLPFITHNSVPSHKKEGVREAMNRILDGMPKEAGSRAAIKPLELETLRFKAGGTKMPEAGSHPPFELMGVQAGFGFDATQALSWAAVELLADCCFLTYDSYSVPSSSAMSSTPSQRATKRRRKEGEGLEKLLSLMSGGQAQTRLLATQVIVFFVDRHWSQIHGEAKDAVRRRLLQILDDDDIDLQSWAFIGLSCFATIDAKAEVQERRSMPLTPLHRQVQHSSWGHMWEHAIRKVSVPNIARAACHAAEVLLHTGKVDQARSLRDIHLLLKSVSVQGPPQVYETTTSFLVACLDRVRADSGLYAANLEDEVIDWFVRTYSAEGYRKTPGPVTPINVLNLFTHICDWAPAELEDVTVLELLPDCPIVNRVIEEATTEPLRQLILNATMPAPPVSTRKQTAITAGPTDVESLALLDGRPHKLSYALKNAMEQTLSRWALLQDRSSRHLINATGVRKSIDLVVLALSFQAVIHVNGHRPETSCLNLAEKLLAILLPHVRDMAESVNAQLLVWRGFAPLFSPRHVPVEVWPILLKPDRASGIRRDVLPSTKYASHYDEDDEDASSPSELLLSILWSNEQTITVLDSLVQTAKHALETVRAPRCGTTIALEAAEDDDFGPIINADSDTMPASLESRVAQRSTSLLVKTLVDLRLRGQQLRSPERRPPKDTSLINTFVQCESAQFAQLGAAVCDAIQDGSLRLTINIVDVIMAEIEDRIATYGFKRDSEVIRLAVVFLARTAAVWLAPESGLGERAIQMIKGFVLKVHHDYPTSWQARLQLLLFIDEYLEYDPTFTAWTQLSDTDQADVVMGGEHPDALGPMKYNLDATSDPDARVRFRAATSAAAVHYLPDLPADVKSQAYYDIVTRQSSDSFSADHFLTNLVWKINTCVASAQLRSGTIFHLYEVADFAREFLIYLRPGLAAIANRLGLSSLQPLFCAHANVVVVNQLGLGQLPLALPPEVYGCETRKQFAQLCLEAVGSKILAEPHLSHNLPFFKALCNAAGVKESQARRRHLPFAAAIAVAQTIQEIDMSDFETIKAQGLEALHSLQAEDGVDTGEYLTQSAETVVAALFTLVDLHIHNEEVLACLDHDSSQGGSATETFALLMRNDQPRPDNPPALDPAASISGVLGANQFFLARFPSMSKSRMVFSAVVRLFHEVNSAYLVNEQRRYLRAVALLASLYQGEFASSLVLQEFLRNSIDLLSMDDVGPIAFSMVQWGFDQLLKAKQTPPELANLLIKLGAAYGQLQAKPHMQALAEDLNHWVGSKSQTWHMSDAMMPSLESALVYWPQGWVEHFRFPKQHFLDVAELAKRPSMNKTMALSKRLVEAARRQTTPENKDTFMSATFWYLKQGLNRDKWTAEGATAFLQLLDMVNGKVHAPSLDTINNLTGRADIMEVARKLEDRPRDALRVIVLLRVLEQTTSDDYRLRYTAYEVLQTTLPIIKSSLDALPPHLRELTAYLVPDTPASSSEEPNLEALGAEASWIQKSRSHEVWAKDLALLLGASASTTDEFYACLQPMLSAHGNAAVLLLPFLVQSVLQCDDLQLTAKRADILSDHFSKVLQFTEASLQTIEAIIHIVLHLRNFKPPYAKGELSYNHWLSIDPLELSEAAGRCGSFASSLLFLEMAKDRDEIGNQDLDLSDMRVQKVMYDIYSNVEDPDGFYGVQNNDVMDSLHRRLDHEGQYQRAMCHNLAQVEAAQSPAASTVPLISALRNQHNLGFHELAFSQMKLLKAKREVGADSDAFFLDLAWRVGDWDVPVTKEMAETSAGRFYNALRAVHRERDYEVARGVVNDAICAEMAHLQEIGVERMTEIKKVTADLLCLRDVEHWVSRSLQQALEQDDFEGRPLTEFVRLDPSFEFKTAERLSATRLSLIRSARMRESKNLFGDLVSLQAEGLMKMESQCQLRMSQIARKEGNLQAAVNAITAVSRLEESVGALSEAAQDEFSQVLWAQGEHALAIKHVGSILNPLKLMADEKGRKGLATITARHAILLSRQANWYWLAKLKSAEEIRSTSRRAMDLATAARASHGDQAQMAHDFAVFTDRYHQMLAKSPELERVKQYVDRRQAEVKAAETVRASTPGSRRSTLPADHLLEEESQNMARLEDELLRYVVYAVQSYAAALSYTDKFDDSITRLCSLWLEHDTNQLANEKFALRLPHVPTHKFLFLSPQLSAKLFRPPTPTPFNTLLNDLILRTAQEHPYHILYQIITLADNSGPPRSSGSRAKVVAADGRVAAAQEILDRIAASTAHRVAQPAVKAMKTFADLAVAWCYADHHKSKPGQALTASSSSPLMQCRGLMIPVATVPPPVDLEKKYENVPTLDRYRSSFKLAGGIHRPSIMTCIDSLGQHHVQLFKGEDDVRQDAVMEQVFEMTNRLLQRDRRASARSLTFRTYNVVNLANRSGIIQFVGNTTAIGDWLKDAHQRYRGTIDVKADVIRRAIGKLQESDKSGEQGPAITKVWKEHMAHFHPVMRHFFSERRREPLAWFTMRLNYARSVAVTSMVGWMIGLGDRHCSNILIDKVSGELVHIDFGIVFEEGKKLRIPEKVPFRLTNDIVDGLGVTGVEGTFRQCSEHTLRVLRESSELILTVLEVFKHDPLHNWVGDPSKMRRAGGGQAQAQNVGQDKAERVLTQIRQKLGPELSVEYRVNQLMQEAQNEDHLSRIFIGWQSWL
ncbi:hypothetical protein CC85DRAFT_157894 [Cutaneotrichosporon oleaginosum]|uniref:Serine/threonine-protein kinase Tel1 n=1 Tax=Cutaneotrichosporon oleaginosum TaxID=879819 RepID=A0A0J0XGU2_9TREE|nr:uncharacterized protein CC85DRAFT_157894 [Cutaneotrichosporon oleaginosum]KLT40283.1 hypothetical protein CC85DRAFT_157894 [Cutaneotrichosporon oleaginosum]TXT08004.1 hypothetical protein COLE_04928 [Cutaneotrichosporon oleaginosum]